MYRHTLNLRLAVCVIFVAAILPLLLGCTTDSEPTVPPADSVDPVSQPAEQPSPLEVLPLVPYISQIETNKCGTTGMNNCAPASLAMVAEYYGLRPQSVASDTEYVHQIREKLTGVAAEYCGQPYVSDVQIANWLSGTLSFERAKTLTDTLAAAEQGYPSIVAVKGRMLDPSQVPEGWHTGAGNHILVVTGEGVRDGRPVVYVNDPLCFQKGEACTETDHPGFYYKAEFDAAMRAHGMAAFVITGAKRQPEALILEPGPADPPEMHVTIESAEVTPVPAAVGPAVMVYPDVDGYLRLYNAETGYSVILSETGGVTEIRANPMGDRIVYMDSTGVGYVTVLHSTADGELSAEEVASLRPQMNDNGVPLIEWHRDGTRLQYLDPSGEPWIIYSDGTVEQLPTGSGSLPTWSYDDRYWSYIRENVLWLASEDGDVVQIAGDVYRAKWSPTRLLLAYTTLSTVEDLSMADDPEDSETYIYDVEEGQSYLVTRKGALWYWFSDGEALVVIRLLAWGVHGGTNEYLVAGAHGKPLLTVATEHTDFPVVECDATDARLVGPWEVDLAAGRVRTAVEVGYPLDWSSDARYALVLKGSWGDDRYLYFYDRVTDNYLLLFSSLGGLGAVEGAGMWGFLSPRATWAYIEAANPNSSSGEWDVMLARTDGGGVITASEFPGGWKRGITFSADDRWAVYGTSNGWALYNLETRTAHTIPGVGSQRPVWLIRTYVPAQVAATPVPGSEVLIVDPGPAEVPAMDVTIEAGTEPMHLDATSLESSVNWLIDLIENKEADRITAILGTQEIWHEMSGASEVTFDQKAEFVTTFDDKLSNSSPILVGCQDYIDENLTTYYVVYEDISLYPGSTIFDVAYIVLKKEAENWQLGGTISSTWGWENALGNSRESFVPCEVHP